VSKFRILLLTNRDSDNVGDQIIEATVISLLKGVMKNLGLAPADYVIRSRAAGIISKNYLRTGDPSLIEGARAAISSSDVIVFGGAPLFNYSYQNFYLRTIKTLELAQEYGVPVIFSSIGVEPFDETNPKSVQLRDALQQPCVRQITTRDDVESVRRYVEGTDIPVAHVSDPAVFADIVFRPKPEPAASPAPAPSARPTLARRVVRRLRRLLGRPTSATTAAKTQAPSPAPARPSVSDTAVTEASGGEGPRRIGLVVTRAGIFRDNGIAFTEADQRAFWLDVIDRLEARGDDYRLFTTGHFSDEVFLDALIRSRGIPLSKAAITVNSPEELSDELRSCDGVLAYRLHASITAFAYGVPSIGLSWNFKVPYFYESVGLGERALPPEKWTADEALNALDRAMDEGVTKDQAFLMSVYETLFSGIKSIAAPDSGATAYSYAQLRTRLPRYAGTTPAQYRDKVRRKLRRAYENYQRLSEYHLRVEADKAAARSSS
jgi:polysaccharide pyruvyl transferase WcaK-like protein